MDKQIRPFGMRDKIGYMFGDFQFFDLPVSICRYAILV